MAATNFSRLTNSMNKDVKCPSCGAAYDIHAKFCPYCGSANEYGQEEAYMDKLEQIGDALGEMSDDAQETYSETVKSTFRRVILPMLIVIGVLIFLVMSAAITYSMVIVPLRAKKQVALQNEIYPVLDEMYEAGEFEELEQYTDDLLVSKQKNDVQVYNWKHYRFLSAYNKYSMIVETPEWVKQYPDDDYSKQYALYCALELCTLNWDQQLKDKIINKRDYEYIMEYKAAAIDFLKEHYGITDYAAVADRCRFDFDGEGLDFLKVKEISGEYEWVD